MMATRRDSLRAIKGTALVEEPTSQRGRGKDDQDDQRGLNLTDAGEGRCSGRIHSDPAPHILAPANQRHHGPELEEEDDEEEAHLGIEGAIVEIVARPLLQPGEDAKQARGEPKERREAPEVVGAEDAAEVIRAAREAQGAAARPDGT